TIRLAVEATARWTGSNTNLGVVLLLAPLAKAAIAEGIGKIGVGSRFREHETKTTPDTDFPKLTPDTDLRDALRRVLDATGIDDARDVYAAIRQAAPGGL